MIKNKDFILLLIGRVISNFGDSIYHIATMTLIYELTSSSFYTGLALFLTSFMAIFQMILSPILNRINIRKFLYISQLIQAIMLIVLAYLYINDQLSVLKILIIMPLVSLINQMVYPAQISLLPKILKDDQLIKANSFFQVAYQGVDALFNALGGIIISIFGFFIAYIIDATTFIITFMAFLSLKKSIGLYSKQSQKSDIGLIKNHFMSLKNSLSFWKENSLIPILIGGILINFNATAIYSILPEYTGTKIFYSILLSSSGIGILIGSIMANMKFIRRFKISKLYSALVIFLSLCWGIMSIIKPSYNVNKIIVFALFSFGWISIGIVNIFSQTLVQILSSKENLASIMASMLGLSVAISPLGALFGGIIASLLNVNALILISSISILIIGLLWHFTNMIDSIDRLE
ncbi:MAG: MFS transporter [Tissierellia bacterium]|nr:MFS transporter [Tissierellia bacterium]